MRSLAPPPLLPSASSAGPTPSRPTLRHCRRAHTTQHATHAEYRACASHCSSSRHAGAAAARTSKRSHLFIQFIRVFQQQASGLDGRVHR